MKMRNVALDAKLNKKSFVLDILVFKLKKIEIRNVAMAANWNKMFNFCCGYFST